MDCAICRRSQTNWNQGVQCDGIETVEQCPTGQVPKLMEENDEAVWLFDRMLPGLQNGMGGWNYGAIAEVFNVFHVKRGERPFLFEKCLIMMQAIREIRETEKK